MPSAKKILISLSLPITATILVPIILLILVDNKLIFPLFNNNIGLLTLGAILLLLGLILFLECNYLFFKIGEGTLMPHRELETKEMVIVGPYKYVRNPLIISVIIIQLSEALIFNSLSIFIFAILFFVVNVIYMPMSEEKGMERRFGEQFLHYKKNVRAWLPSVKPYSSKSKDMKE